ncbi:MAG: RNA polymerase sigma factor [Nannocystales bacterium]
MTATGKHRVNGVPTDDELLDSWLSGDEDARERLLGRHYSSVRRFFESQSPSSAADLTQCTMIACVSAIRTFERRSSFRTFLYAIARRKLAYFRRRESQRRPKTVFNEDEYERPSMTTPSRVVAGREEHRLLMYALTQIPSDQRVAFELFYWEAMSNREVAERLNVKITTVTTRLSRARKSIQERISDMRPSEFVSHRLMGDLGGWMQSLRVVGMTASSDGRTRGG